MILERFGAAVGDFLESGSTLTDSELCAFEFSDQNPLAITQLIASFQETTDNGVCAMSRLLLFTGGKGLPLGDIAREQLATNLETKYGVKILLDVVGIQGQWSFDFASRPLQHPKGLTLYALHMPPYATVEGDLVPALMTLTVLGYYLPSDDSEGSIYPGYKAR